ncbi:MAG: hypothetical protein QOD86_1071 [Miltoncostaeaceae bacterium]|jgi:hypothetical protein|nr:hypothetical protein [Miltoncostaeaceae bacterium]
MTTLRIEATVSDFDTWKAAFDRDELGRASGGVRALRIHRPVDDPNCALIDLDFDGPDDAGAFMATLERFWARVAPGSVLLETPRARLVEPVETAALAPA